MPIIHNFVSLKPDGQNATLVQPSNWNANHTIDIFIDDEVPAGMVNGENRELILGNIPFPEASLQLFRNGALQQRNIDYTLAISTITWAQIPNTGDIIRAWYRKA